MTKTEITIVKTRVDSNDIIRDAVDREKFNEYRQQWADATSLKNVTDFPIQLDFELNYSCNFTCPMCTWNAESTE